MRTWYQCEKCARDYDTVEDALNCENRLETVPPPPGLIYQYSCDSSSAILMVVKVTKVIEHILRGGTWAARDGGSYTDNGEEETCSLSWPLTPYHKITAADMNSPAFARCLAWCERHKLTPTYWDGTNVCSFPPTPPPPYLAEGI